MKELVALLFGVVLIAAGWNQPYREHYAFLAGTFSKAGVTLPAKPLPGIPGIRLTAPAPVTQTDKSWMWQKGALDNPQQSGVDQSGVHTVEPKVK